MSLEALTLISNHPNDLSLGKSNWCLRVLGEVVEWRNSSTTDENSSWAVCVVKVALITPVIPFLIVAAVVEAAFRVALGLLLAGFVPFVDAGLDKTPFSKFVFEQLSPNGFVLAYTPAMITGIFRNFYAEQL